MSPAASNFGICNEQADTSTPAVVSVSIAPASAHVNIGASRTLAATGLDVGGQPVADATFDLGQLGARSGHRQRCRTGDWRGVRRRDHHRYGRQRRVRYRRSTCECGGSADLQFAGSLQRDPLRQCRRRQRRGNRGRRARGHRHQRLQHRALQRQHGCDLRHRGDAERYAAGELRSTRRGVRAVSAGRPAERRARRHGVVRQRRRPDRIPLL